MVGVADVNGDPWTTGETRLGAPESTNADAAGASDAEPDEQDPAPSVGPEHVSATAADGSGAAAPADVDSWVASARGDVRTRNARRRRGRRPPNRRRRTLAVIVVVIVLPLALLVGAGAWVYWQIDPPGGPGAPITVSIEEGWGVAEIADHLDDQGVIGSSLAFQIYARVTSSDTFQAGRYELASRMGIQEAVRALEDGPVIDYANLPVIPGLWLTEIANRVDELPGLDGERFLELAEAGAVRSTYLPTEQSTLEGLLWPDTYRVSDIEDERDVLASMVSLFETNADDLGLADASVEGLTPYEVVVVASLVQQEARLDAERPVIASVIYNRLRDGTPLQIDGSVLYCIGERKASNTAQDRAVDCPHNTYLYPGLPPTPIGSVTVESLEAALEPADTPYRFYVLADEDGSHAFAQTFEEHQRNVERARELGLLG